MAIRVPFDSSQQVSSGLALLFVIVLSAIVAWMAVSGSTEIISRAKEIPRTSLESNSQLIPRDVKAGR